MLDCTPALPRHVIVVIVTIINSSSSSIQVETTVLYTCVAETPTKRITTTTLVYVGQLENIA